MFQFRAPLSFCDMNDEGTMERMKHPYISGPKNIGLIINQLRSSFPSKVTVETIKKFRIAPKNERYLIHALKFTKIIDSDGAPVSQNKNIFFCQNETDFQTGFAEIIKEAYSELYDKYSENMWALTDSDLIQFFREADHTTDKVGKRQAGVFKAFSALSGKIELSTKGTKPSPRDASKPRRTTSPARRAAEKVEQSTKPSSNSIVEHLGMSIKIDVNLPSEASKETYDHIFKSIREHLIDG